MAVFFARRGAPPIMGESLSNYAEGDIVLIPENSTPIEFYVAKHDYESGLNGAGRTLLVRKDCYDTRAWDSGGSNAYASSDIDSWLNGAYKNLLSTNVQNYIGATTFYYTPGYNNNVVTTIERSIFILSVTELGLSNSYANVEGSAVPISTTLKIAYLDGRTKAQWTRSPYTDGSSNAFGTSSSGRVSLYSCSANSIGSRPCFTLPANTLFDPDTNIIKE